MPGVNVLLPVIVFDLVTPRGLPGLLTDAGSIKGDKSLQTCNNLFIFRTAL